MGLEVERIQLREERLILEGLIKRYGNVSLITAHDHVSVALDYYRGETGITKHFEL